MLPTSGKNLHGLEAHEIPAAYPTVIAMALKREVGDSARSIKTLMRWTGAGERTVKNWLGAVRGPSGAHLIALVRHSATVYFAVLSLSGRLDDRATEVESAARLLREALVLLED
jgi:N-acyl-D-aspartate/D-glutamate deacylase